MPISGTSPSDVTGLVLEAASNQDLSPKLPSEGEEVATISPWRLELLLLE